jgi:hypothetical protein
MTARPTTEVTFTLSLVGFGRVRIVSKRELRGRVFTTITLTARSEGVAALTDATPTNIIATHTSDKIESNLFIVLEFFVVITHIKFFKDTKNCLTLQEKMAKINFGSVIDGIEWQSFANAH